MQLTFDPFDVFFQDTFLNGVQAYNYCADTMSAVDGSFYYNWGAGDTSIATVDAYGTHTGTGVGSTSSFTSGTIMSQGGRICPLRYFAPSGTAYAGPYQVEPMNTASQFPHACTTPGQAGWERNVTNQVQFKDGSPYAHSGLTVTDNLSIGRNDLNISYQDIGSYQTTGDGSFPDSYYDCSFAVPLAAGKPMRCRISL